MSVTGLGTARPTSPAFCRLRIPARTEKHNIYVLK
jgi:hypothetical protein